MKPLHPSEVALRTATLALLLCCTTLQACKWSGVPTSAADVDRKEKCARSIGEPLPRECPRETRPVTSGLAAVCIALKVMPPEQPVCAWHYSVTFRDSRWLVTIHDSSPDVRDRSYLIQVDPKSGKILKVQGQR